MRVPAAKSVKERVCVVLILVAVVRPRVAALFDGIM